MFKGGTCLKKCYTAVLRFSQDLDFTVLPGGPSEPGELVPILKCLVERVHEESGIDFGVGEHFVRTGSLRRLSNTEFSRDMARSIRERTWWL